MTAPIDIAGLRKLCEAATPGPWGTFQDSPFDEIEINAPDREAVCELGVYDNRPDERQADADFIAAARTALPALLDALEQASKVGRADHWADCAVNHGGPECDMGPECGMTPEQRAHVLGIEKEWDEARATEEWRVDVEEQTAERIAQMLDTEADAQHGRDLNSPSATAESQALPWDVLRRVAADIRAGKWRTAAEATATAEREHDCDDEDCQRCHHVEALADMRRRTAAEGE